jgi:hypothetical protein
MNLYSIVMQEVLFICYFQSAVLQANVIYRKAKLRKVLKRHIGQLVVLEFGDYLGIALDKLDSYSFRFNPNLFII